MNYKQPVGKAESYYEVLRWYDQKTIMDAMDSMLSQDLKECPSAGAIRSVCQKDKPIEPTPEPGIDELQNFGKTSFSKGCSALIQRYFAGELTNIEYYEAFKVLCQQNNQRVDEDEWQPYKADPDYRIKPSTTDLKLDGKWTTAQLREQTRKIMEVKREMEEAKRD